MKFSVYTAECEKNSAQKDFWQKDQQRILRVSNYSSLTLLLQVLPAGLKDLAAQDFESYTGSLPSDLPTLEF